MVGPNDVAVAIPSIRPNLILWKVLSCLPNCTLWLEVTRGAWGLALCGEYRLLWVIRLIHVGLTQEWKRRWASPPYHEMTEWVEMSPTVAVTGRWVAWWQRVYSSMLAQFPTQCKMTVLAVEMGKLTCWGKSYRKKKNLTRAPIQRQRLGRHWRQKMSPFTLMGTLWILHNNGCQDLVRRPAASASIKNVLKQNYIGCIPVYNLRSSWGGCSHGVKEVAVAWVHGWKPSL